MGAGFSTSKIPRDVNQQNRSKAVFVRGLIIFKITWNSVPAAAAQNIFAFCSLSCTIEIAAAGRYCEIEAPARCF